MDASAAYSIGTMAALVVGAIALVAWLRSRGDTARRAEREQWDRFVAQVSGSASGQYPSVKLHFPWKGVLVDLAQEERRGALGTMRWYFVRARLPVPVKHVYVRRRVDPFAPSPPDESSTFEREFDAHVYENGARAPLVGAALDQAIPPAQRAAMLHGARVMPTLGLEASTLGFEGIDVRLPLEDLSSKLDTLTEIAAMFGPAASTPEETAAEPGTDDPYGS